MNIERSHWVLTLAIAVLLVGCQGASKKDSGSSVNMEHEPQRSAEEEAAFATYQHDESGDVDSGSTEPTGLVPMTAAARAPDLNVLTSDTLVYRKEFVDVTVQTTMDAVEVVLSDGLGDRQALAYDEAANVWRGQYRVPLRTPSERLGLSVTAKNAESRWRRVWVFLSIRDERPAPETKAATEVQKDGE